MITIKQHDEEWRLEITGECWEVSTINELKIMIGRLCELKEEYGKIK